MVGFVHYENDNCTCPNCGYLHRYTGEQTGVISFPEYPRTNILSRAQKRLIDREKWDRMREAELRSRELSLGSMPAPIVRRLVVARLDPLRHHKLRCMTRRPRLSLRERALA